LQTVEQPVLEFQRLRVLTPQDFAFFKQQRLFAGESGL
jgi:hypothetical protein